MKKLKNTAGWLFWGWLACIGGAACAAGTETEADVSDDSTEPGPGDTMSGTSGDGGTDGGTETTTATGDPALTPSRCPEGELALGIDGSGAVVCDRPDLQLVEQLRSSCSVAFGVRDVCGRTCSLPPAKWATTSSSTCTVGIGQHTVCRSFELGGNQVEMLGVNTDGDVNDDDRFYFGFACTEYPPAEASPGPCSDGEWVVGAALDGSVTCQGIVPAALNWVRDSCELTLGWQDRCQGCSAAPTNYAQTGSGGCFSPGSGGGCQPTVLGSTEYNLASLLLGGDVNNDDMFTAGVSCEPAPTDVVIERGDRCPEGTFLQGITATGALECVRADAIVRELFAERCSLYMAWRDVCESCTQLPASWGRVGLDTCSNGAGANNVCTVTDFDGVSVQTFKMNTGGDVNGDDTFYFGWRCE